MPTDRERQLRVEWAIAIALSIVAFVVFSPGLFGPFLWDDKPLILGNAQVRSLSAWPLWFTKDFWDVSPELLQWQPRLHYFRPLVTASYAIEFHLVGARPFLFHLDNLLAHSAAAVLAFFALRRWSGSVVAAGLGAAFFAVHPTKAESVAWIAGRTDVFCAVFVLVAAGGAALRFRGKRIGLAVEIVATLLAYFTKEGAIVLPAFIALERWVALDRPVVDLSTSKRLVRAALPQLAVAIAYLVTRAVWMPVRPSSPKVRLLDHVQFVLETLGRYLTLAFAPHDLSGQHALLRTVDGRSLHVVGYVVAGLVALVALTGVALLARRRAPMVTLGLALFAGALLPVSNLMMTGISTLVAERFLYLPLLGIALAIAGVVEWLRARVRMAALIGVASIALLSLAVVALDRSLDFADEARFWEHERALHPESLEALRFAIRVAREEHQYRKAEALALEGRAAASRWYSHNGAEAEFVLQFVELRAVLTPDLDVESLQAIDAFDRMLLDPSAQVAALRLPGVALTMPLSGPIGDRLREARTRVLAARAELLSRLAHDPEALALVDEARGRCPTCARPNTVGALVAARAGDYPKARTFLAALTDAKEGESLRSSLDAAELARKQAAMTSGPMALQLSASELARLEAWGRAYAVLAPFRAQIELAPGFAVGFAELAFRAGDEKTAREVLAKHVAAEKIEPTIDQWAIKMGWR